MMIILYIITASSVSLPWICYALVVGKFYLGIPRGLLRALLQGYVGDLGLGFVLQNHFNEEKKREGKTRKGDERLFVPTNPPPSSEKIITSTITMVAESIPKPHISPNPR